jgi:outer membrane lipoprotein-sorting protein
MKKLNWLIPLLLLLSLLLGGCSSRNPAERLRPKQIVYQKADPNELFLALKLRNEGISTLRSADAKIEYRKTDGVDGYTGVGLVMALKKPGKIYARGRATAVGTVFSMLSDGKNSWVELDREKVVYTAKVAEQTVSVEAQADKNLWKRFTPDILIQALLIDDFSNYTKTVVETLPDFYIINLIDEQDDGELLLRRRIWFERENLTVRRHALFNNHGEMVSQANLHAYKTVNGIELPHFIRIEQRWEKLSIKLTLNDVRLNQELDDDFFEYDGAPSDYQVIDIDKRDNNAEPGQG